MRKEHAVTRVAGAAGGYAAIAMVGLGCVIGPAVGRPLMKSPLFPLLRTGVENLGWETFVGLGVLGLVAGIATRLPVGAIALASVILLPVAAFLEIAADGTSHNLIPLELAMYAVMGVPALVMAKVGRMARGRVADGETVRR